MIIAEIVSSDDPRQAALHNTLETLRDPSHVRMLCSDELCRCIRAVGFRITATSSWNQPRQFEEWIRIASAPERAAPLHAVMLALAAVHVDAGMDLRIDDDILQFGQIVRSLPRERLALAH